MRNRSVFFVGGFRREGFRKLLAVGTAMALLLASFMGTDEPVLAHPAVDPEGAATPGSHALLVQPDGQGTNPAVSAPIQTQAAGSALLVMVGGYASNAAVPSDNYGNTWIQRGPRVAYDGYSGRFDTAAYVALPARGGKGHRIRLAKDGTATGEITAPFVEIRHADVLQDVVSTYARPGVVARLGAKVAQGWSSAELTSGTVTTTGPATLVAVWWGDAYIYRMTAVPDNGFKVIERFLELPPSSGVQCAVAVRQVDSAGRYRVTWTGTPAQGAILWLFAFQAAHKGVGAS